MHNGFLRVASCAPNVSVANVDRNVDTILQTISQLENQGVEIAVFPEMAVTGYTCADLFHNQTLIEAAARGLETISRAVASLNIHVIVGIPIVSQGAMYNCAALLRGSNVDLVAKSYIPNYNEFYERRWWRPIAPDEKPRQIALSRTLTATIHGRKVFRSHGALIGIEICEDLWVPIPPSAHLSLAGAQVIFNLSASDDLTGKYSYLKSLIAQQSARCLCGYVYASAGWGESSTDLVFDGKAIIAENGTILACNPRWDPASYISITDIDIEALERDRLHFTTFSDCALAERASEIPVELPADEPASTAQAPDTSLYLPLRRYIDPRPFVPSDPATMAERCDEILNIQTAGLARRLDAIGCRSLVVGISGGLDSTLALLVAVRAFNRLGLPLSGIIGVTMPGFGTTDRTHSNAVRLMSGLGVSSMEIPIGPSVMQHFADIGHDPAVHDVTYENCQARERTQILMDLSNRLGGIVLGTGDLSELALGWATYNGDHISMYGVNAGVPKTLVRHLVKYYAMLPSTTPEVSHILLDVIDTPISPELIPASDKGEIIQRTEDLVGPYELHDFFLYYTLRYGFSPERIRLLARQAFSNDEYDDDTIDRWLSTFFKRFFAQQFKRSCLPDGPKVGSVCLSPRGDWRMPSDASSALWRKSLS